MPYTVDKRDREWRADLDTFQRGVRRDLSPYCLSVRTACEHPTLCTRECPCEYPASTLRCVPP